MPCDLRVVSHSPKLIVGVQSLNTDSQRSMWVCSYHTTRQLHPASLHLWVYPQPELGLLCALLGGLLVDLQDLQLDLLLLEALAFYTLWAGAGRSGYILSTVSLMSAVHVHGSTVRHTLIVYEQSDLC